MWGLSMWRWGFSYCLAPAKKVTVYGLWLSETWQRFKPLTYAQSYKDVIKGFKTETALKKGWDLMTSKSHFQHILFRDFKTKHTLVSKAFKKDPHLEALFLWIFRRSNADRNWALAIPLKSMEITAPHPSRRFWFGDFSVTTVMKTGFGVKTVL